MESKYSGKKSQNHKEQETSEDTRPREDLVIASGSATDLGRKWVDIFTKKGWLNDGCLVSTEDEVLELRFADGMKKSVWPQDSAVPSPRVEDDHIVFMHGREKLLYPLHFLISVSCRPNPRRTPTETVKDEDIGPFEEPGGATHE